MTYPTRYPGARWRPVPINHSDGGMRTPTRGLIPHVQMGRSSLFDWFSTRASGVSSHLWLSRTGEVEQYVAFDDKAWAQAAGNPYWISCECAGTDTEDYTPIQVQRLGELYAWGMTEFGWPAQITDSPAGYGLGTHRMGGTAWGGHSCPGDIRAGRRRDILAAALGRPPTPPPTEQEDAMTPEQETRLTKALAALPGQVAGVLTTQMRQLVTTDPDTGRPDRMADVSIGSFGEALGLLVLRSSFGMRRDGQVLGEVSRIADYLGDEGPVIAWTKDISARVELLVEQVTRLSAGAGGAVDLSPVLGELRALAAQLGSLTLTVAPGGAS